MGADGIMCSIPLFPISPATQHFYPIRPFRKIAVLPEAAQPEENSMRSIKIVFFSMFLILTAFFIFQNTAVLQTAFLFWSVSMSACLILLITFFGFSSRRVGQAAESSQKRRCEQALPEQKCLKKT
jgi:uncharacterized integral membrane protein